MTRYQKIVVAILAFIQFSVILDLLIIAPLGVMIMPSLNITPQQFGFTVSVYAIAAGISGIVAAGFSDRYDRKKFLLFFYCGFIAGTLLCALATSYYFLVFARLVTGLFGGVIASVIFAIVTDIFPFELRGRVIGTIQTAFATSAIAGTPLGLYIAGHLGWRAPFYLIALIALGVGGVIVLQLQPLTGHIGRNTSRSPFRHLWITVSNAEYLFAFSTLGLANAAVFMIYPFSSAFIVHNLGVGQGMLPTLYMITGVSTLLVGPVAGRAADKFGKLPIILFGGTVLAFASLMFTSMGATTFPIATAAFAFYSIAATIRSIPYQALVTAVPSQENRGAFTAINSAIGHLSASSAALTGLIISETSDGRLENFNILGYISVGITVVITLQAYVINRRLAQRMTSAATALKTAS